MVKHVNHATFVVRDVEAAKHFFGLLGFEEDKRAVITGERFSRYMGVNGLKAEHVALAPLGPFHERSCSCSGPLHPEAIPDPQVRNLARLGFNHICFTVDNLDAEVERLKAAGVELRSDVLDFHSRKLVFLCGPEGVTVELAEWH